MDNIVTINNTKENVLDFDISIQGLTTTDIRVWFCIKTGQMDLNFQCSKGSGDGWEVTIPKIPFIEKTAYACAVCVVADGYYFEAMNGTLNVTGSAEVYVKKAANVTLKPTTDEPAANITDVKPTAPSITITPLADRPKAKMGERSIAQVAKEMMGKKFGTKPEGETPAKVDVPKKEEPKKEEPKEAPAEKDVAAKLKDDKEKSNTEKKTETPPKDETTGKFTAAPKDDKNSKIHDMLAGMKKTAVSEATKPSRAPVEIKPITMPNSKFRKVSGKGADVDALAAAILAEAKTPVKPVTPEPAPIKEVLAPVVTEAVIPEVPAVKERSETDKKVAAMLEGINGPKPEVQKKSVFRKKS